MSEAELELLLAIANCVKHSYPDLQALIDTVKPPEDAAEGDAGHADAGSGETA